MKAGPGSVPPPNMLTSGGMPGSPSHGGGSPMMHPQSHTPNSSQGQMSPVGPGQGHVSLGHHSPGIGGNPHHQHQHQHHSHLQQQHHQHNNGLYGIPGGHHTPTPSPAGDMSPQGGHHMPPSGSPTPMNQWHSIHQQDIKPPPHMNPGAPHGMFPQYSWYQTADNNMGQGLIT